MLEQEEDTVTIKYSIPQEGWISIGFTNGDDIMIGADAVVGTPNSGEVKKLSMSAYENAGIIPMSGERQLLIGATIVQE